ncbi:MAG: hypothetical protein BZY81_05155 [SAR202 cluster bacterium Io17-Chloro-G4]|nr:MAG: hypothetical protein BZY81_05155 [SAR202 cluster bacterium Io17-Chloro-G4]
MTEPEDRTIAEDLACPVEIQPGKDEATPPDWTWRLIGTSLPNAATFHVSHSDVSPIMIDVLHPSDTPPDAPFVVTKDIPIIIMDSLDKYWAGEAKHSLPLNGIRVPVENDTVEGAKTALAADLAAQMRLLLLLSSSGREGRLAPQLRENLMLLSQFLEPRTKSQ